MVVRPTACSPGHRTVHGGSACMQQAWPELEGTEKDPDLACINAPVWVGARMCNAAPSWAPWCLAQLRPLRPVAPRSVSTAPRAAPRLQGPAADMLVRLLICLSVTPPTPPRSTERLALPLGSAQRPALRHPPRPQALGARQRFGHHGGHGPSHGRLVRPAPCHPTAPGSAEQQRTPCSTSMPHSPQPTHTLQRPSAAAVGCARRHYLRHSTEHMAPRPQCPRRLGHVGLLALAW